LLAAPLHIISAIPACMLYSARGDLLVGACMKMQALMPTHHHFQ
jgi:hypothetical protein